MNGSILHHSIKGHILQLNLGTSADFNISFPKLAVTSYAESCDWLQTDFVTSTETNQSAYPSKLALLYNVND